MTGAPAHDRVWQLVDADEEAVRVLSANMGLKPVVARVLAARGYATPEAVARFLQAGNDALGDPFQFHSMAAAVERMRLARERRELVVVHGDYDADGITAAAMLTRFLRSHGWCVETFLPRRMEEGYGIAVETVRQLAARGVQLLLTVDCGVTAHDAVEEARTLGVDVIVTDHHQPEADRLPRCAAVLNPHCDGYPFSELCGAGVALKLAWALHQSLALGDPHPRDYLDLVAVGTISDVVSLRGENRALCVQGLRRLRNCPNLGLRALAEAMNRPLALLEAGDVAFGMAPRINAAGRLGDPALALELLVTDDIKTARCAARALDDINKQRRATESVVIDSALAQLRAEPALGAAPVVALADAAWHRGVLGVVAARLVERLHKPVIMLALEADGMARGSARSVEGVDITALLRACRDELAACGGHEMAAGLTLEAARLPAFRARLAAAAARAGITAAQPPPLRLDAALPLDEIDDDLLDQLRQLEPFGNGNPTPRFCVERLNLSGRARIVGNNHLKITLPTRRVRRLSIIAFHKGDWFHHIDRGSVDVAFELSRDVFQGACMPQLKVVDIRRAAGHSARNAPQPAPASPRLPRRTLGPLTIIDGRCPTLSVNALGVPRGRRVPLIALFDECEDARPLLAELRACYGAERVAVAPGQIEPLAGWADKQSDALVTTVETCLAALRDPLLKGRARNDAGLLLAVCTAPPQGGGLREIADGCARLAPAVAVRLCWTPAALARERQRALTLWPDRAALIRAYTALKRNASKGRVDLLALQTRLAAYALAPGELELALRIFEEADVCAWDVAAQQVCLRAEGKRNLESSPAYRRCQQERAPIAAWYDELAALQDSDALFDRLGFA